MKGLKKLRRLFALLMAMIMVMGTCITTQAADTGSITITNAAVGETYSIYKLFDVTYDTFDDIYKYTVASEWENFFSSEGDGADYVDVDTLGHVTWKDSADAGELAGIAIAYAQDSNNGISAVDSDTATAVSLKFENLEYGYYLVDSSLGAICSLTTACPDVEITDKNGTPTVEKVVEEDSTNVYGESNTAEIGDSVNFRTEITNASNVSSLVLYDTMSDGLHLDSNSIKVLSGESLSAATEVNSGYYTITTESTPGMAKTWFNIEFTDEFTAILTSSDIIYVEYTATVSVFAEIGSTGNKNETYVTYGSDSESKTDTTTTYVYDLYIYKYDGETEEPLEGAKFVLTDEVENRGGAVLDVDYRLSGWSKSGNEVTQMVSGSNGLIRVAGLDAGTYFLEEWEAPTGYNTVKDNIYITITEDGILKVNDVIVNDTIEVNGQEHYAVKIANSKGNEMPSTGGIGTTIFYVVGSIMALGAAVLLITRRRMHES